MRFTPRQQAFSQNRGLVDQIRREAVSVMSNIGEGFERGTTAEFVQFLYVAKGSCGEVRVQLQIANDQRYISDSESERLRELSRQTSGMISNFIAHLQRSDYRGEKTNRFHRHEVEALKKRQSALREAQMANMPPEQRARLMQEAENE